jgi:NAD(P)H-dependent FMN reductase
MKVLCFAGALRSGSVSKLLVQEAIRVLSEQHGVAADHLDLKDYPFPVYDTDIEQTQGIPESISQLSGRVRTANALIIASPEYNGGISSVLKTAVDWLSRVKPMPLKGKFLLLMSASPSGTGGVMGLWHSRLPFEALGVHVFPFMVAVPRAQNAFNEDGRLTDAKAEQKLRDVVSDFVLHVGNHHPLPARNNAREALV